MKRLLALLLLVPCLAFSQEQIIVSISPDWNSITGKLRYFNRTARGWESASPVIPVLYGPKGLAWGRGLKGQEEKGLQKVERDGRAPAGLFEVGKIYTYDKALPEGAKYPFHTVTPWDAWIDDVKHPQYNRHVQVDPKNVPPWFEKQKMRHNDFAYRWLIEIRHNSDPVVPGMGSAIFFHTRRGVNRPSAGCTVMAREDLLDMIRWLRAEKKPRYVLLPRAEYERKWQAWGLPAPDALR